MGRQQAAPGPILGRPKRAKSVREASKSFPGPVPRRPRTPPKQRLSAFGAPSAVAHVSGTIFHLFGVVVRKLRCAFRISFNGVLLTSDEINSARARTVTTLENQGVSASKIDPETVRGTQNRDRAVLFERYNAKAMRKIYKSRRRSQSNGQSGDPRAFARRPKSAQAPKPPRAKYLQIDWDIIMCMCMPIRRPFLTSLSTSLFSAICFQ